MTAAAVQAIRVQGLEKSYNKLDVLRGVDFDAARGSIFALLGSNGAGKTTIVKIAWLAVAGILLLFTLALTWIAMIPGLSAKSADGVSAFSYPLIFLPFISSAFVPTQTMPGAVRAFAEHQPVTSIVNAIHHLFTRQPVGSGIWIAFAWCLGILIAAYTFSIVIYRRRIS